MRTKFCVLRQDKGYCVTVLKVNFLTSRWDRRLLHKVDAMGTAAENARYARARTLMPVNSLF